MSAWIAPFIALLIAIWAVAIFNKLVRLRNQTQTAWADIDVQLARRHDLVPPLVTAVKAYAGHERAVLEAVTELRGRALQQHSPAQLGEVESELERALTRLIALQEAYPDLKSSANFLELQRELVAIEEQLQYARRYYNGSVRDYNIGVQRVPDFVIARLGGFHAGEFYQAEAEQRSAVLVQLR